MAKGEQAHAPTPSRRRHWTLRRLPELLVLLVVATAFVQLRYDVPGSWLGLEAPEEDLATSFEIAASFDLVKGFAVGRTIFGETARKWMAGEVSDEEAVAEMARRYERLCAIWDRARSRARKV